MNTTIQRTIIGIALLLSLAACGSTATNTGTSVTGSTPTQENAAAPTDTPTATATPAAHFKMGQVVSVGSLDQVTVNSVKTATSQPYITPKAGNIYLLLEVSVKNVGSSEQRLSSLNYTLRDATGQEYNQTIYLDAASSPQGKCEAGQTIRGTLAYEVPIAQKAFTFSFEVNSWEPGQTMWDIHV